MKTNFMLGEIHLWENLMGKEEGVILYSWDGEIHTRENFMGNKDGFIC